MLKGNIFQNSDSGIKHLLPTTLNQTLKIVEDSAQRVEDVVDKFDITLRLINEVYIASLAKQGKTQRMNQELEKERQLDEEKKRQAEERLKNTEQQVENKIKKIEENRMKFDQIQKNLTKAERENRIAPEGRYTHSPYIE